MKLILSIFYKIHYQSLFILGLYSRPSSSTSNIRTALGGIVILSQGKNMKIQSKA